jgi:hypothetical protein
MIAAMDLAPLSKNIPGWLQSLRDYAVWELIGAAGAYFGITKKKSTSVEVDKATKEGAMFLTPDGWETDQRRFENSDPIKPR